jgi:hypothetical protein
MQFNFDTMMKTYLISLLLGIAPPFSCHTDSQL